MINYEQGKGLTCPYTHSLQTIAYESFSFFSFSLHSPIARFMCVQSIIAATRKKGSKKPMSHAICPIKFHFTSLFLALSSLVTYVPSFIIPIGYGDLSSQHEGPGPFSRAIFNQANCLASSSRFSLIPLSWLGYICYGLHQSWGVGRLFLAESPSASHLQIQTISLSNKITVSNQVVLCLSRQMFHCFLFFMHPLGNRLWNT